MHNNPVLLTREIINKAVGEQQKNNGPTIEEIAKENERLRALHEGWIQHPITLQLKERLQKEYDENLNSLLYKKPLPIEELQNRLGSQTTLHWILNYLKTFI